jgi:hypothetical protein
MCFAAPKCSPKGGVGSEIRGFAARTLVVFMSLPNWRVIEHSRSFAINTANCFVSLNNAPAGAGGINQTNEIKGERFVCDI